MLLAHLITKNPFTDFLEGKGLLSFNLDSTGIITAFISKIDAPYIKGKLFGKQVKGVFDRQIATQMSPPIVSKHPAKVNDDGSITITIDKNEFAHARFAMSQYPVLLYNEQLETFITKDMISKMEKETFAEYTILYMNRVTEELTRLFRDFGRYVVELTKPKSSIWSNWIIWVLLIGGIGILAFLFLPKVISYIQGGTISAMSSAADVVTPR